jgi:putative oxidoreductase
VGANERYTPLAGRILIAVIFLLSGLGKLGNWGGTASMMASKGLPLVPLLLPLTVLFELGGGLSVLLGFKARIGAIALILFLIPVTLVFHDFWAVQGPQRQMQMINFLKNVAIMGGLAYVVAFGAGPLSIDARAGERASRRHFREAHAS